MKVTEYISGSLRGTVYEFTQDDMHIHWHSHEKNQCHNVIVLKGSVRVEFEDKLAVYLKAGDLPFDFDGESQHRISAIVPGTVILNLFINRS